jgi:hypothetical protein
MSDRNKNMTEEAIINFLNENNAYEGKIAEITAETIDDIITEVLLPMYVDSISIDITTEKEISDVRDNASALMTCFEKRIEILAEQKVELLNSDMELKGTYFNAVDNPENKYIPIAKKVAEENSVEVSGFLNYEAVRTVNSDRYLKGLNLISKEELLFQVPEEDENEMV